MIIIAIVFLILFGALAFLSTSPRDGDATNAIIHNATLNVSSEGPIELSKIIDDIKTADYYKGYDNETVKWMESLGNKYVFVSEDAFVVMDKSDSDKIPSIYACDVIFNEIFSCDILENHTLGNVKYPKDVLYVENVKYIREEGLILIYIISLFFSLIFIF